ncbi:hypothetical protein GS597_15655 [Synechococcales cyanobacterium C]|uniref:DoxX family membrane protein n=1 Tax=Petrachloros mirabilis ULC683 TaxID=2781853 RepID=A0A8K2A1G9_9CYAN|nr:hypothetical protein [Petrachloros mirabilis]NCJ07916.1 hypothetical protein [Petrachloros mirabilis ULC683]
MAVLIVLLATFAIAVLSKQILSKPTTYRTCGHIAIATMFTFAGISHFGLADDMVAMLPAFVPFRYGIIYATGLIEIALATGFLWSQTIPITGILAIAFLIAVFPANIYAALNAVDLGGHAAGPIYLLFRVPMQVFLVGWIWFFCVRDPASVK